MPEQTLFSWTEVSKAFGRVQAVDSVSLDVRSGEVVALVGDNGAGKSTLVKTMVGAIQPDSGEMRIDGESVHFHNSLEAAEHGIAVVYQDLALVDQRDVATNVFLGREPGGLFVQSRKMHAEAESVLRELNIAVIPTSTLVGRLSGGQRQAVAIARAVHQGGRLVLMDEPTAALGVAGQLRVLGLIRDLRDHGRAVLVVSHNLEQVFDIADRIVVLRHGSVAGVRDTKTITPDEIVHLITGADRATFASSPSFSRSD